MNIHKLVPMKPTDEMLEAGAHWCGQGLGKDEARGRAVTAYKAMLAAAPECGCCGRADRCDDDCDAAPQPVEQQPVPCAEATERKTWLASLFPEDRMFEEITAMARDTFRRHQSSARGQQASVADNHDSHLIWATKRWIEDRAPKPAPDVAGLAEALEALQAELETVKKVAYGNIELLERNEALQAECETLRRDAERYRWLRLQVGVQLTGSQIYPASPYLLVSPPARESIAESTDFAIDATIAAYRNQRG